MGDGEGVSLPAMPLPLPEGVPVPLGDALGMVEPLTVP